MNATKELEQWWRWVDGEAPSTLTAQTKARDVLPDVAEQALRKSALMIVDRHGNHAYAPLPGIKPIGWALENHFDAFKALSLSLCEALGKMRERVPEAKREMPLPVGHAALQYQEDMSQSGKRFWSNLPETDPAVLREQMKANLLGAIDQIEQLKERHAARVYGQVYGTGLGQHMYIDPASLMPPTCESMGRPHLSAMAALVGQRYCVRCTRYF